MHLGNGSPVWTSLCIKNWLKPYKMVTWIMHDRNQGLEVVSRADGLENIPEYCNIMRLLLLYWLEDPPLKGKLVEIPQVRNGSRRLILQLIKSLQTNLLYAKGADNFALLFCTCGLYSLRKYNHQSRQCFSPCLLAPSLQMNVCRMDVCGSSYILFPWFIWSHTRWIHQAFV